MGMNRNMSQKKSLKMVITHCGNHIIITNNMQITITHRANQTDERCYLLPNDVAHAGCFWCVLADIIAVSTSGFGVHALMCQRESQGQRCLPVNELR